MKINTAEDKGVVIISLEGAMLGGGEALELSNTLHTMIDAGNVNGIIDLDKVTFINSSGLGMLISGLTTLKNAGGNLKVARANDKVKHLLTITKLTTVFQPFDTLDDAVASFVKE
jgi:anti-sigma B factor antagonist